jgi:hypothetical protein
VETFTSYAENAHCISATETRYVVIQPDWIQFQKLPDAIEMSLNEKFDCSVGMTAAGLLVCPARGAGAP